MISGGIEADVFLVVLLSTLKGKRILTNTHNAWNMFKANNKNTSWTTTMTSFWCLYCSLWTYFIPFSSVSIVDFEQCGKIRTRKNSVFGHFSRSVSFFFRSSYKKPRLWYENWAIWIFFKLLHVIFSSHEVSSQNLNLKRPLKSLFTLVYSIEYY